MGWQLTFHFEKYPKIVMQGFVTAIDEGEAVTKFKLDYPNLAEYVITEVVPYEGS